MSDEHSNVEREVIAVRRANCRANPEIEHTAAIKLKDGSIETADAVITAIDDPATHVHYVMRPPEGAPAYQAHQETGLLLELQVRECPDCAERILFA
jgi:hypothetical protein